MSKTKRRVTVTIGPVTGKPDALARDFLGHALTALGDAGHSRAVDRVIGEFGIRTLTVTLLGPAGPVVRLLL